MMSDIYIYVQSDESNNYFSENQTSHFKVHLKVPIYLEGTWKVALVDFRATENASTKTSDGLYIYSDVCGESIVQGDARPLLRR
jgi:arylamine N-acetyltransferase